MSAEKFVTVLPSCEICGKIFQKRNSLNLHRRIHQIGKNLKCEHCNKKFMYTATYITHIQNAHSEEKKRIFQFRCPKCERRFETKRGLKVHTGMNHSNSKGHKCAICGQQFKSTSNLKFHVRSHELRGSHRRERDAKLTTGSSNRISDYMKTSKEKIFKCKICNESFKDEVNRLNHFQNHEIYKCAFCEKFYHSKQILYKHIKESHKKDVSKHLTCAECGDHFDNESLRFSHMVNKHWKHAQNDDTNGSNGEEDSRFTCDTCGELFASRFSLKNHIIEKHYEGNLLKTQKAPKEREKRHSTKYNINGVVYRRKNSHLNLRILQDYEVALDTLTPTLVDPESKQRYFVCKVCLTTYSNKDSFNAHIKSKASTHYIYLRRRSYGYILAKTPLKDTQNELSVGLNSPTQPIMRETDLHSDNCKDNDTMSLHLQQQQQAQLQQQQNDLQNKDNNNESPTCNDMIKVIDVRSIATDFGLDTASNEIAKQDRIKSSTTNISTEKHFISDDTDFDSTDVYKDAIDAYDMQPLYTARRLLPEEYTSLSTESEQNKSLHFEEDGTEHVTEVHGLNNTFDGGNDTQFDEHSSDVTSTTLVRNEREVKEGTNGHVFTSEGVNSSFTEREERTHGEPTFASNMILSQNQILRFPHRCRISLESNSDSLPLPIAARGNNAVQCVELSNDCQGYLQCCLCRRDYCVNCSGLPMETYNVVLRCKQESNSSLIWTCENCKGLVPKFSVILSSLRNFDLHINSRLTKLEDKISTLKQNYEINKQP